jgi:hypothetical protein
MFANIRRHQKWLWILISAAVIISFTWYLNPNNQGGGGGRADSKVGSINGHDITRAQYLDTQKEAHLRYLLSYGTWYGTDEFSRQNEGFIERETKNRLLLKEKIREYNIHVTPDEIAHWITEAFGRERPFSAADYERFIKTQLEPHNIRENDFERFVKLEVGVMHLINVAGLPGRLVTPQEAEAQYRRDNEQVAAEIIVFNATNYTAKVNADTNAIMTFFTNRKADYREPEKIQLSYVEFPASNYFAQAEQKLATITNLSQQIDAMYMQRGEKFFTHTNGAMMTAEAAKQKLRNETRNNFALVEAQRAATEFTEKLLEKTPKSINSLEALANERGIQLKTTEPFSQYESPKEMEVPERFSQAAFALSFAEPYIEEPIRGSDAVYVAGLRNRIPSDVPAFETIRDKVVADYKREQSQKLLTDDAHAFHSKLTNSMAAGKTFAAAATELGHKPTTLEAFSKSSRAIANLDPHIDPGMVKAAAFSLKPGETSGFRMARDGGFILHVSKTIPVSDEMVKTALPEYLKTLQQSGQSEAFQEWFMNEMKGARLTLISDKEAAESGGQ